MTVYSQDMMYISGITNQKSVLMQVCMTVNFITYRMQSCRKDCYAGHEVHDLQNVREKKLIS